MQLSEARLGEIARQRRRERLDPGYALGELQTRFAALEPDIQAFVEEPNRWHRLERSLDRMGRRYSTAGSRPALFGIPVGIKDIIHVDGLDTRAGSTIPPAELTGPEAPVVTALKDAGSVILGKTVTTEFAYFAPGPTRNPHNPQHTPGGSSSGSAAAVAAGLCPLAIGTQTIGSVIRPAAFCGVIGVKPSAGRIPTEGVIPVARSVDHVGYFTQDIPGAQLAAGVLYRDWRANDEPASLRRVGIPSEEYLDQASAIGSRHFEAHVTRLERSGIDVVHLDTPTDIAAINHRHRRLVAAEMALAHAELYPKHKEQYADVSIELIEEGRSISAGELADARAGRTNLRQAVHASMDADDVDLIISPSAPGPAPTGIGSTGDPVMNLPWTHAGVPTVSLPASTTDDGLPIGLQCTATFGADEWLLSWCRELDRALS